MHSRQWSRERKSKVRKRTAPRVLDAIRWSNQDRCQRGCCCGFETAATWPFLQQCDHHFEPYVHHEKRSQRHPPPRPPCISLPPLEHYSDRAHGQQDRNRRRSPLLERCNYRQPRHYSDNESNESDRSAEDAERDELEYRRSTIRDERFRSIAALSRLQHTAATAIQQEFRFYRRRCLNRRRRAIELDDRARAWLASFLRDELERELVPCCLLELLADKRDKALAEAQHKREMVNALAIELRDELVRTEVASATRDTFSSALRELVAEYMSTRATQRLERAATDPIRAVASDVLADWTRELGQEVLLQVLDDLTSDYLERQQLVKVNIETRGTATPSSSDQ